jgi:hypothetical protein
VLSTSFVPALSRLFARCEVREIEIVTSLPTPPRGEQLFPPELKLFVLQLTRVTSFHLCDNVFFCSSRNHINNPCRFADYVATESQAILFCDHCFLPPPTKRRFVVSRVDVCR